MSSNSLVITPIDGEPRIDSRLVSAQLDVEHKNTRDLINTYISQFQELGSLPFEVESPPCGFVTVLPDSPKSA